MLTRCKLRLAAFLNNFREFQEDALFQILAIVTKLNCAFQPFNY